MLLSSFISICYIHIACTRNLFVTLITTQEMSDEYKAAQAKLMLEQASDVDIIITTALIPCGKAPVLVNQEMLNVMKAGSVIVDLAAANGGNVAHTEANQVCSFCY